MGLKRFVGKVVSNRMDKTAVIAVPRNKYVSKYKRTLRVFKKFKAHDESNSCNIGDIVQISETRPLSKTKRWRVTEMLKREKIVTAATPAKSAPAAAAPGAPLATAGLSTAARSMHAGTTSAAADALAASLAGMRMSGAPTSLSLAAATAPRGWRGGLMPFAARAF